MAAVLSVAFVFLTLYEVFAVPIVLKESTPNGESVIAISASDPEVEKYLLNSYTSQRANADSSLLRSNFYYPEVEKYDKPGNKGFNIPDNSAAGSGRNFGESRQFNPFFVPFLLPPNLDAFQLNNWFRNIENIYEQPSFAGDREIKLATAVNDNSHVYGKVGSIDFNNKRP